jgi:hypothetical protein
VVLLCALAISTPPVRANAAPPAAPSRMPAPAARVASTETATELPPKAPKPTQPALRFDEPAPVEKPLFGRWWFWSAVGTVAAATLVVVVLSSRGHAPPATDLGNQEFHP